jgi:heme/copper-type cytochrome/quinol oxidase subunit 2
MRGFRLNGWQRIGIVLSLVWAVVGGLWGRKAALTPFLDCLSDTGNLNFCQSQYQWAIDQVWLFALIFGLAPIPIAWLLVYIVVWTVRWIRRGFQPSA